MRYHSITMIGATLVAGLGFAALATGETPGPAEVKAAAAELASSDAATAANAARLIEQRVVGQIAALLQLEDAESADRAAEVLAHHAAVSAYLRELLARPQEKRAAAMKWVFSGDHLSLLSVALSARTEDKLAAARRLAGEAGEEADALLARLLCDKDWDISGAAIDAAVKRTSGPMVIDALWDRCVTGPQLAGRRRMEPAKPLMFRGKPIANSAYEYSYIDSAVDNAATDALVALKSPLVEKKIVEALEQYLKKPNENLTLFQPYYAGGQSFQTLASEYRPKRAVPLLMEALTAPETFKQTNAVAGVAYFWSSRTMPLVLLARITEQDPADYQLTRRRDFGNQQWLAPSEKVHREAEEKMRQWYAARKSEYVTETPTTTTAPASAPATSPAAAPARK